MISACEETRRGLSKHVGDPTLELSSGPDRSSDSPDNYSPPIGLQLRERERERLCGLQFESIWESGIQLKWQSRVQV